MTARALLDPVEIKAGWRWGIVPPVQMPPLDSSAYHPGDSDDSCPGVWIDVHGHLDGLGGAERNLFSSLNEASLLFQA